MGSAVYQPLTFPASRPQGRAIYWSSTSGVPISLHPAGYLESYGWATSGSKQVGYGILPTSKSHALLWSGTAASAVDLHPFGNWKGSIAKGIYGNTQVGYCETDGFGHAYLWQGSALSAVDLNPAGFSFSVAAGVYGNTQVGGGGIGGARHALLWSGTASSAVDLHPAEFTDSWAYAVSSGQQAGYGRLPTADIHALVWFGTAASAVDLNPAGFNVSTVMACATVNFPFFSVRTQVGSGYSYLSLPHALVWSGSAASVVDLHATLANLGNFDSSYAYGISSDGREIVGTAYDTAGNSYSIVWR